MWTRPPAPCGRCTADVLLRRDAPVLFCSSALASPGPSPRRCVVLSHMQIQIQIRLRVRPLQMQMRRRRRGSVVGRVVGVKGRGVGGSRRCERSRRSATSSSTAS
eukprot:2077961-Rhodomonas_salina.1